MSVRILQGDCREVLASLPEASAQCVVTSPPYFDQRDYGMPGQIGQEETPAEYIAALVAVFREVRRVLRDDGTVWLNLGDSYAGARGGGQGLGGQLANRTSAAMKVRERSESRLPDGFKPKDLMMIPARAALALHADGRYLRSDIIWAKKNCMPESVKDRPTKAHEYIFLLAKSERYYYDADAIAEPGVGRETYFVSDAYSEGSGRNDSGQYNAEACDQRNKRTVWHVGTRPFNEAHFATFPPDLIEPCILAGSPIGAEVLDPFGGAGTTGLVADRLQRNATLIELNPEYAAMARRRIAGDAPLFAEVE